MAEMSTGLKDYLLDEGSMKAALADGYIHIYAYDGASTVPGPDDAVSVAGDYTLLATIYSDGGVADAGLEFGAAADGVLPKAPGETWDNSDAGNVNAGTLTARFFVHTASAEADGTAIGASTTAKRIVGTVAQAGGDLNLSSTSLTNGQTQQITSYSVSVG